MRTPDISVLRPFVPVSVRAFFGAAILLAALLAFSPVAAQGIGWDRPRWGHDDRHRSEADDPLGKVTVASFAAELPAATVLGHAAIEVTLSAGVLDDNLAFESALIDQLVAVGYDTAVPAGLSAQVATLRIVRDQVSPAETKHKPISGEMAVGVSNRGTSMGLALTVDLSKPRGALVRTRIEVSIRDRETDSILWEGRADMVSVEGDDRWRSDAVAARLAQALFARFPEAA
ncbi:DUF4136 domain-containing protein [Altericroceibacterium xinjiangense]|uniref:DUF4136 domain-containing protein n=1 Tax=Altericroceibacterium xinjiangense TaxID=762261 RepID=UPI000F7F2125|nr:DUF4136 domain-containing protein [Altericroceibacterium xinjiangense]